MLWTKNVHKIISLVNRCDALFHTEGLSFSSRNIYGIKWKRKNGFFFEHVKNAL